MVVRHGGPVDDKLPQIGAGLVPEAGAAAWVHVEEVEAAVSWRVGWTAHQLTAGRVAVVVQLTHFHCSVVPEGGAVLLVLAEVLAGGNGSWPPRDREDVDKLGVVGVAEAHGEVRTGVQAPCSVMPEDGQK